MGVLAPVPMESVRIWSVGELAALDLIDDAAWVVETEDEAGIHRIWWANDTACSRWSLQPTDHRTSHAHALLPEPLRVRLALHAPRLAAGERVTERVSLCSGGAPVALTCTVIRIDDGRPATLVLARAADAVPPPDRRALEALRHSKVGLALYGWPDGHALMRNPAALQSCPETGSRFQDRFVVADDAAAAMAALAAEDGFHGLARLRTAAGERWHGMDALKTWDPVTGQPAIVVNTRDVTDIVLAEEALRRSERRLAQMVEHLPIGAAYVENERLFLNKAAERITGYSRDELPTFDAWLAAAYPTRYREVRERYDTARKAGAPVQSELEVRCKNGSMRWIRFSAYLTPEAEVWLLEDVTEHRATLEALHHERALLQSLIESMPDIVFFKDPDGVYLNCNRAASEYAGRMPKPGERLRDIDLVDAETAARRRRNDALAMEQGTVCDEEWIQSHDGRRRLWETVRTACRDREGRVLGVVGISRDITDRRAVEETLRRSEAEKDHLANHDPLTGLPNRRLFANRVESALARSRRSGHLMAVLFIDLDGFKPVNDRLGHDSGDLVLRVTAERLVSGLRATDMVARVGGDEFVALLEGMASSADVDRIAAMLVDRLSAGIVIGDETVSIGASIGIALHPHDAGDAASLLKAADNALYEAKRLGRGRHVFCRSAA